MRFCESPNNGRLLGKSRGTSFSCSNRGHCCPSSGRNYRSQQCREAISKKKMEEFALEKLKEVRSARAKEGARHSKRLLLRRCCRPSSLSSSPLIWLATVHFKLLLLFLCANSNNQLGVQSAQSIAGSSANSGQQFQLGYYVSLAKLGLVRGLRIAASTTANKTSDDWRRPAHPTVAAFLGVPYAGSPTGLLRFMPPGGQLILPANKSTLGATNEARKQYVLMPGGRRAIARDHSHFGPSCVKLADWLPRLSATEHKGQQAKELAAATTVAGQSEDCLNLNVFVPVLDSSSRGNNSMGQQIKPNYPSRQQAAPATDNSHFNPVSSGAREQASSSNNEQLDNQDSINQDRTESIGFESAQDASSLSRNKKNRPLLIQLWPIAPAEQQRQDEPAEAASGRTSSGAASSSPLPVLVLFHGSLNTAKANTLSYLAVAERTKSVVVTFNYRIGLLGFLPYVDSAASGSASGARSTLPRNNHAIWDQIGLLHWLKRNVANFNGDPKNVTLLAVDNQAAQLVQLLTMSPLAKGLFQRAILVQDGRQRAATGETASITATSTAGDLSELLKLAGDARELRRRLANTLGQLIQRLLERASSSSASPPSSAAAAAETFSANTGANTNSSATNSPSQWALDERQVFEFIQAANLSQLARLDNELNQLAATGSPTGLALFALANGPSLDDRLLFPHLSALVRANSHHQHQHQQRKLVPIDLSIDPTSQLRSSLNYCLYVRRLYSSGADPLGLIVALPTTTAPTSKATSASSSLAGRHQQLQALGLGWRRDSQTQQQQAPSSRSKVRRSMITANFNHLYHVSLLAQLVHNSLDQEARNTSGHLSSIRGDGEEDDEEDDDENVTKKQQDRSILLHGGASGGALLKRRQVLTAPEQRPTDKQLDIETDRMLEPSEQQLVVKRSAAYQFGADEHLEQLVALVASYDLMLGYFSSSSTFSIGQQDQLIAAALNSNEHSLASYNFTNIASSVLVKTDLKATMSNANIEEKFFGLLKVADLHFLLALISNDTIAAQHCDFFSPKAEPVRSSYAFLVEDDTGFIHNSADYEISRQKNKVNNDWLLDSLDGHADLVDGLSNFIRFGDPNTNHYRNDRSISAASDWPAYDTLERKLKRLRSTKQPLDGATRANDDDQIIVSQIRAHLDMLPYLSALASQSAATHQQASAANLSANDQLELIDCLSGIESALNRSSLASSNKSRQQQQQRRLIQEESKCLINCAARFRSQLRHYAADDLEPLVRLHRQQLESTQHPPASTITTRNLVNDGLFLQLDQQQQNSSQPMESADQQTANSSVSVAYVSTRNSAAGSSEHSASNSHRASIGSGIKSFFAKTYKDAMGKALSIVVGTGLLIFFLNLAIVIVIALRSAQTRRRAHNLKTANNSAATAELEGAESTKVNLKKKSSLKRTNSQQAEGFSSIANTADNANGFSDLAVGADRVQLAINSHGHNCNTGQRAKQLKFDLTGVGGKRVLASISSEDVDEGDDGHANPLQPMEAAQTDPPTQEQIFGNVESHFVAEQQELQQTMTTEQLNGSESFPEPTCEQVATFHQHQHQCQHERTSNGQETFLQPDGSYQQQQQQQQGGLILNALPLLESFVPVTNGTGRLFCANQQQRRAYQSLGRPQKPSWLSTNFEDQHQHQQQQKHIDDECSTGDHSDPGKMTNQANQHHQHNCPANGVSSLNSPFASYSHSNSTTTSTSNAARQQLSWSDQRQQQQPHSGEVGQHRHSFQVAQEDTQQFYRLASVFNGGANHQHPHHSHHHHHYNHHNQQHFHQQHSTASPGSSTTLSMTPIQLESLGLSPGQCQLEPIGLIYQTDLAGNLMPLESHSVEQETEVICSAGSHEHKGKNLVGGGESKMFRVAQAQQNQQLTESHPTHLVDSSQLVEQQQQVSYCLGCDVIDGDYDGNEQGTAQTITVNQQQQQ